MTTNTIRDLGCTFIDRARLTDIQNTHFNCIYIGNVDPDVEGYGESNQVIIGKVNFTKMVEKIKEQEETIEYLANEINENRTQIQALLDYCFTDRERFK